MSSSVRMYAGVDVDLNTQEQRLFTVFVFILLQVLFTSL